ncbi:FtsQ-type POTRA domain-containing protein, partial [Candidatus Pelagibacter sp.]|nr:FtsQ-type POTRA domain-containing protein [Candidatus Pelagibacter sp.]
MHQRKGKKILIYFFLLLVVGSINNISLNNLKFKKINYIDVNGLGKNNNALLLQEIKNLNLDNIFSINKDEISNPIDSNSLVENYNIFKRYPSSIHVNIEKTKFLARINEGEKIFLVGSNGKLTKDKFSKNELPFIFGNPNIDRFLVFKKMIDQSKISYDEIKNLYFFSSKRWDLELKNNIVIKLPKNNMDKSLQLAFEFL